MKRFEVGSILYLIPEEKFVVIPSQVTEEVIRKSLDGETTDYHVSFPGDNKNMLLKDFRGDIFDDISSVTDYLLGIAKEKVKQLVNVAEKTASENFEIPAPPKKSERRSTSGKTKNKAGADDMKVDLGNGQTAKVVMNDELKELLS